MTDDRVQWAVRLTGGDVRRADPQHLVDLLEFGTDEQAARRFATDSGKRLVWRRWRYLGDGTVWVGEWTEEKL